MNEASSIGHALLCAVLCVPLAAAGGQQEELKAEIVMGCTFSAGEFGTDLVNICIDESVSAVQALNEYPAQYSEIIRVCTARVKARGWAVVKLCVDDDIAAMLALERYPDDHEGVIAECIARMGMLGPKQTKACVDKRLESAQSR